MLALANIGLAVYLASKVKETSRAVSTDIIVKGACVYETPFDFRHLDTLHKGKGAEIETYDKRHNHLGAICPHCGAYKPGSLVPGRMLPKN
ncbi:hypothetical protein [Archangium sp.]|uniref:hypothetical protein n=1 Tax=Archangium sp. TaxID=1872627 RepID=UPI002D51D89B|nr:hypothetical protein [Archangium sp.]HYO54470.1 hypothetical protein [Archangium sp.]